eukprot:scaffold44492_cov56-Attheya_sp.AAC.7
MSMLGVKWSHSAIAATAAANFEISVPILFYECASETHLSCPQSKFFMFCIHHVHANFVVTTVSPWCNVVHLTGKCLNMARGWVSLSHGGGKCSRNSRKGFEEVNQKLKNKEQVDSRRERQRDEENNKRHIDPIYKQGQCVNISAGRVEGANQMDKSSVQDWQQVCQVYAEEDS